MCWIGYELNNFSNCSMPRPSWNIWVPNVTHITHVTHVTDIVATLISHDRAAWARILESWHVKDTDVFDQSKISWGTICYDLLGGWGFPSIWLRARPSLVLSILCARNLGIWVFWIFLDSTWPHKIIYRWTLLTSCSYAISRWESIKGPQHSNSLLQGSLSEKNDLIWEVEHLMVQQSLEQQMNSRHTIKMMAIMHDSESIWNVGLWRLQLRNIRSEFF